MNILNNPKVGPFIWFLYGAIIVTALCALVYTAVQQNFRQSLNDPQIQMAEDAAAALSKGDVPASVVPRTSSLVDLSTSLAPWIAVYDSNGQVLEASGQLNNNPPKLPPGVFDTRTWDAPIVGHHLNTQPINENRFSWQPNPDVRQAVVLVHYTSPTGSGYVAAGRNMREIENREGLLVFYVFGTWVMALGALFVLSCILWFVRT